MHVDVHQHVWPDVLVEELRRRSQPPRLDGWTLLTSGEPPFEVNPADHDAGQRAAQAARDGVGRAIIGLSSPLGIEYLAPGDAEPLLDAYHHGVAELGAPFAGWAAACLTAIDAPGLAKQLDRGFAGLQLPATAVADESGYRWCGPLLDVLAERDLPLFIHPGPAAGTGACGPAWWAAVVPYVQQLHAAWFAFRAYGRPAYPRLRVCFTALAGLGAAAWRAPGRARRGRSAGAGCGRSAHVRRDVQLRPPGRRLRAPRARGRRARVRLRPAVCGAASRSWPRRGGPPRDPRGQPGPAASG